MVKTRTRFKADFKVKVSLKASKEIKASYQIAQKFGLYLNLITTWKKGLHDRIVELLKTMVTC